MSEPTDPIAQAAENADWGQVILNGGPPCFHLEGTRFCLRARRWQGHRHDEPDQWHPFVSLADVLRAQRTEGRPPDLLALQVERDAAVVDAELLAKALRTEHAKVADLQSQIETLTASLRAIQEERDKISHDMFVAGWRFGKRDGRRGDGGSPESAWQEWMAEKWQREV